MFIPYKDENPTRHLPVVTWALIIANAVVFYFQVFGQLGFEQSIVEYGLIPCEAINGRNLSDSAKVHPYIGFFSYMFMHGNFFHIFFNMLYLWIFGNNVEDRMSRSGFLVFYLLIGFLSGLLFTLAEPGLCQPLVGASGAVSGILGAYLFLFPFARIRVWMLFFVLRLPAIVFLPIWFLLQVFNMFARGTGDAGGVAWVAHVAGFIAGGLFFALFKRKEGRR